MDVAAALFSEDARRNPFPVYEKLRAASPLLYVPPLDLWMLFDYDGVKRAMTDHDTFSSDMRVALRQDPPWLIFFDPPRHTKLRALIMRAFTPRVVAGLEPRIRELSRALLGESAGTGEMDLATDFAIPLPMLVIAEMLGIPAEDRPRFRHWSDVILALSHTLGGGEVAQQASADYHAVTGEMAVYLAGLVEQRRTAPGGEDDLLTQLVAAEVDGERLTPEELLGFFQLLLVAGSETTTNLINNAVLCFLAHPEQFARLRSDPDALLPPAIEEVLRYRSPVQWMFRATRQEIALHGQVIPAGKLVLPVIGSANHDPRPFPEPDRFDITRTPNPHVAFGHGIHFCLGAALSRLEARVALSELLQRVSDLELASDAPWEPRQALHVHGPARLPVRFTHAA
jgi:cytochrome P450